MIRTGASVCIGLLAYTFVATAHADVRPLPFQVHAVDGAGCGASGSFATRIMQRSSRLQLATTAERAIDFSLTIGRDGRAITGELGVHELDGTETVRSVAGASCDEVLSALALIAAVLVDPNALREPSPPLADHVEPPPVPRPPSPSRRWGFGAGVGFGLESGVVTHSLFGESAQLEAALGGEGLVSPRFALAWVAGLPDEVRFTAGTAHVSWSTARASGCPLRLPIYRSLTLRPCAAFDVGRLRVSGDERSFQPTSQRVLWLALGAVGHFELRPISPLLFGLDAGIVLPLSRDRFYFDRETPDNTLRIPGIGFTLRLGVGVSFE